jgi:predicted AAA+ superfamily ATPase
LGIQKRREFEVFLKLCALRTGQLINFEDLGRDAGVSGATAKEWLSLLEDSFILKIVHPYHSSRSKRLIKTPKLYFLDAGLAAFLAGWSSSDSARLGPMDGALFETRIYGQIVRAFAHRALSSEIYFLRTKEQEEIDFIVKTKRGFLPIEVKLGSFTSSDLLSSERVASFCLLSSGVVVSLAAEAQPITVSNSWTMMHPNDATLISHLMGSTP